MHGMTVRELKELLASLPADVDDHVVILSEDPEGNGFDTLADVMIGWFNNRHEGAFHGASPIDSQGWEDVRRVVDKDYFTDEDTGDPLEREETDVPAICLWP